MSQEVTVLLDWKITQSDRQAEFDLGMWAFLDRLEKAVDVYDGRGVRWPDTELTPKIGRLIERLDHLLSVYTGDDLAVLEHDVGDLATRVCWDLWESEIDWKLDD